MTPAEVARIALEKLSISLSVTGEVGRTGVTIVFLLDENHSVPEVIAHNIQIANALINEAHVEVVGIENVPATIDEHPSTAVTTPMSSKVPAQPRRPGGFETAMIGTGRVVGIDSPRLQEAIFDDVLEILLAALPTQDLRELSMRATREHAGQVERSIHFVRALRREVQARRIAGNALISCGSDHNTHILEIANGARARPDGWPDWAFVRIRSSSHP